NGCFTFIGSDISANALLTVSPAVPINLSAITSPDCSGLGSGTIDLTVTGGSPPIVRYTWSGGLSDQEDHIGIVLEGTYDVEVEDSNGCTEVLNNIVVDGPPEANDQTPTACSDAPGGTT